jgi:hypothetical protein
MDVVSQAESSARAKAAGAPAMRFERVRVAYQVENGGYTAVERADLTVGGG